MQPDVVYLVGADYEGDLSIVDLLGCAVTPEEAEARCTSDEHWVMALYLKSGKLGGRYYPNEDDY